MTAPAPTEPATPLLNESSVNFRDPKKGNAVRGMFAGIARRYDLLNHLLSFNRDKAWRRATVRLAAPKPSDRVLDVCCGTGDLAFEFRRVLGPAARIVGTDFTPEMVRIARDKARKAGVADHFMVGDTLNLPFPDGSFDICSVGFGIRNVENVAAGIAEMARTLAPGGRVVILEFTQPKGKLFQRLYRWYMTRVLPRIGQMLSGSKEKAYSYLPDSVALFPGPEKLAEMMRSAGLVDVSYRRLTFGIVAIHVGTKR